MTNSTSNSKERGIGLIEVLIAVVVLAFGMLALAALQVRLVQSTADAKARSAAIALAKDKLEEFRAYTTIDSYRAMTSSAAAEAINDSGGSLGGVDFTRSWAVDRYAMQLSAGNPNGVFDNTVPLTGALNATTHAENNEFKTVTVTVQWTDATGRPNTVVLEDAIAAIDPQDSARNQRARQNQPRGPEVRIWNPGNEAGVIPIAVGDNSATAATNPKPVNVARAGDDSVETRFDVLTYSGLTGGTAVAQSRVETTVVGCTCTFASSTALVYRPTYWNGFRYVPPVPASYTAPARAASGVTQSRYCDVCCASHHDPSSVSGPKFSPRRDPHDHYNRVSGALTASPVTTGNYVEACRLIRVDGIFDVAADLSNDFTNLLATGNGSTALNPAPNSSAVTSYSSFVLDYLNQRFAVPAPGAPASTYNNNTSTPDPRSLADSAGLNSPAEIDIRTASDTRWLHTRGLYVDFLEQDAVDAIGNAKANCQGAFNAGSGTFNPPTAAQVRDCVLRQLPFTAINLTELGDWTPITGPTIKVTNDDFSTSVDFTDPIRGKVTPGSNPVPNTTANAVVTTGRSNSGIAIFPDINPQDGALKDAGGNLLGYHDDAQTFRVTGSSSGPPGGTFQAIVSNYNIAANDPPQVGYNYSGRNDVCSATSGNNPYACTTQQGEPLPWPMTVRVGNFNRSLSDTIENPCRNNGTTVMPYREVYDVLAISSNNGLAAVTLGSTINDDQVGTIPLGEYREATVSTIAEGDVITFTLSNPTYLCPSNYPNPGGNTNNPDSRYQCVGNGSNAAPTWSSVYVTCPVGVGGGGTTPPNFP